MGWGTGNLGVGSGGGLNFKVVGNPQPANPSPNTIWLNTDRKITGYYFSATQPENMEEGAVWFSVGTRSDVAFSATKKNPVMVYPIFAKQMVFGTLIDVTAKSWQGGEWVEWSVWLYSDGNEFIDLTGGWTGEGYQYGTYGVTKNADGIILKSVYGTSNSNIGTVNKIDLKDKRYLKVVGYKSSSAYLGEILILNSKALTDVAANAEFLTDEIEISVPVDNLQGEYYIVFLARGTNTVCIKSVKVE